MPLNRSWISGEVNAVGLPFIDVTYVLAPDI